MEKIVIEVLPIDTEGSFVNNHDCSIARAIKRHFNDPEMSLNVGLDSVLFEGEGELCDDHGRHMYEIISVVAYDSQGINFKRASVSIMWGFDDHRALLSGELTKAVITLEKIY